MRRFLSASMLAAVVLAFAAPLFAHGGDTTKIHACVKLNSGNIRIVGANDACNSAEVPLDWAAAAATPACPAGTTAFVGVCIETASRAPLSHTLATRDCADEGRRLPSGGELQAFREQPGITLDANGEWTDDVGDITGAVFSYIVVSDIATGFDAPSFPNVYRCVAGPVAP